jgi:hypothetical protein
VKKRKALSTQNRPAGFGLLFPIVMYLLLDKIDAAPWAWGAVGTIVVIVVIANIVDYFTCEQVEL